ncbi:MAG: methyltransferase/helicase, partial [Polaromonas sp.]|nr:methyltransferase/helicase [Polaromonas sp.]
LPQLLLVPRDETDAAEYERGWKVTDIFPVNSVGIVTARDSLTIHFTAESVKTTIERFAKLPVEEAREQFKLGKDARDWTVAGAQKDLKDTGLEPARIVPVAYRPFDTRFTYYTGKSKGFQCMPRGQVMRHLARPIDFPNLALVTSRLTKAEPFAHAQITDKITEVICMSPQTSNNGFVFPLWLLPTQPKPGQPLAAQRHPNLSPAFLAALAQALGRPATPPHGLPEGVTPEDVLAYVYAVLHAPSYRQRYAGFLKSDFPRIPLSNQAFAHAGSAQAAIEFVAIWNALLPLGKQLIDLHLLKTAPVALRVKFAVQGGNEVEKPRFEVCNGRGRVWINASQYFDGVPLETWCFKVGGYQVCEKWLKDRKGRQLDFADIQHYGAVVAAITRTRALMQEIDAIASGALWPAAAAASFTSVTSISNHDLTLDLNPLAVLD